MTDFIEKYSSSRVPAVARGTSLPEKSGERYEKNFRAMKKVEFVSAPKTGGYRVIEGGE